MKRIRVGTNHNMLNALIHHRPKNELQAKFSMEFCMAILVLERQAGLTEFTDAVVNRPDVQAMIERVEFQVHPEAEAAGYDKNDHDPRNRARRRDPRSPEEPTLEREAPPIR